MIFSLFWEGAFIRRGHLFEGAFILKSEISGGRSFEGGVYSRRGVYSRKYGMCSSCDFNSCSYTNPIFQENQEVLEANCICRNKALIPF